MAQIYEGNAPINISVILNKDYRDDITDIEKLPITTPEGKIIETANPNQKTYHTYGFFQRGQEQVKANEFFTSIAHIGKFDPDKQGKALLESGELARFFAKRPGSFEDITSHGAEVKARGPHKHEGDVERASYEGGRGEGAAFLQFIQNNREALSKQIAEIQKNGSYLHPLSASKLISTLQTSKEKKLENYSKLTEKEDEIVKLLLTGKSYKEIATELNKSFFTVNYHLKNIYSKYNVNSKAELLYLLNKI